MSDTDTVNEYDWVHDFFRLLFVVQSMNVAFELKFDDGVRVDFDTAQITEDIPGWTIRIGHAEMEEPGNLRQAAMFGIGLMRATIDIAGGEDGHNEGTPGGTAEPVTAPPKTKTKRGRRGSQQLSGGPDADEGLGTTGRTAGGSSQG